MAGETEKRTIEIVVNGQRASASLKEMDAAAAVLYNQFRKLSADDPGRAKLLADYQDLKGRVGAVKKELHGVGESTSFLKQGFANAFAIFTGGGILGVVQQVFGFLSSSREEYQASAKITADLDNTLRSTAHAAGLTAAEITAIGEARAKVTLFDDDETNQAAAMLLTFTNIKKGVFEDALPAIQDIATKMGGDGPADLKGASIQVGKALNDPIKGITALSRVGVSFTEQQKEQIAQMVKAGNAAGAQKLILAELNKEFGGSAEAARKAAGGVATLSMRWGEIKEMVGEKVSAGLNAATAWLGELLDKSQPVVDVFVGLWEEASKLYANLYDIAEGLGLVVEGGNSAGFVAKLLTGLFTILLAPIKAVYAAFNVLADGFINLYNKSEVFRGAIGGLVGVFKGIAKAAWDTLGGVGDLLIGVFTLDTEKIKSGLKQTFASVADLTYKSGLNAAENFAAGYGAAKDKRIVRKVNVETSATSRGGGDELPASEGAAPGLSEQELAKAQKAHEAHLQKIKAAQDKADQAHLEALKKQVEFEAMLEDTRVAAIEDSHTREIAGVRLKYQRKAALVVGSEAEQAEQLTAIREAQDRELAALSDKYQQQADTASKERFQQSLLEEDAALAEREEFLNIKFEELLLSEESRDLALYESKRRSLEAKLALEAAYGGETSALYLKTQKELAKLERDHSKDIVENTKKRELAKREAVDMTLRFGSQAVQTTIELLFQDEGARKKHHNLYTALSAAKLVMDGAQELASIWRYAAENPLNGVTGGAAGAIIGAVQSGLTIARTAVALTKLRKFSFAEGGRTGGGMSMAGGMAVNPMSQLMQMSGMRVGASGKMVDDTGFAVAGIVHEDEYVIPKWMREDPQVLAVENWLESRRQRGYAEGGATTDGGSKATMMDFPLPQGSSNEMTELLRALLLEQRAQNARMEDWQRNLGVNLSLLELQKGQQQLGTLQAESAIRKGD